MARNSSYPIIEADMKNIMAYIKK